MKTHTVILSLLALSLTHVSAAPGVAQVREAEPAAGKTASDLFWIADSRTMDTFLASVELSSLPGANSGETLPDTRSAWADYGNEAKNLVVQGKVPEARAKIAQMLKLAEIYRHFGGLQNVVQAEEIRNLAGVVASESGSSIAGHIDSPYLEKNATECLAIIDAKGAPEKGKTSEKCWQHLRERACLTYIRLNGKAGSPLARTR